MDGFLSGFFAFITTMFQGVWRIFSNLFSGIVQIFNFPAYFDQIQQYKSGFGILDWILCILSLILTYSVWGLLIILLVLTIRKYIRFRRTLVGNEDLLEEIADLHRDVIRLTQEKERIMNLKIAQTGISIDQLNDLLSDKENSSKIPEDSVAQTDVKKAQEEAERTNGDLSKTELPSSGEPLRFSRLSAVDKKYEYYTRPNMSAV
jgi:hypothetical protein